MRLTNLQIERFGAWGQVDLPVDAHGLTVFYGANEAGKSTLLRFLRGMFYGFPTATGVEQSGHLDLWTPEGSLRLNRRGHGSQRGAVSFSGSHATGDADGQLQSMLHGVSENIYQSVFAIGLRELQELGTLDDKTVSEKIYSLSLGLEGRRLLRAWRGVRDDKSHSKLSLSASLAHNTQRSNSVRWAERREQHERLGQRRDELENDLDNLRSRESGLNCQLRGHLFLDRAHGPWQQARTSAAALKQIPHVASFPTDGVQKLNRLRGELQSLDARRQSLRKEMETQRQAAVALRDQSHKNAAGALRGFVLQRGWLEDIEQRMHTARAGLETAEREFEAARVKLPGKWNTATLDALDVSSAVHQRLVGAARDLQTTIVKRASTSKRLKKMRSQLIDDRGMLHTRQQTLGIESVEAALIESRQHIDGLKRLGEMRLREGQLDERLDGLEVQIADAQTQTLLPLWAYVVLGLFAVGGIWVAGWGVSHGLAQSAVAGLTYLFLALTSLGLAWGLKVHYESQARKRVTVLETQRRQVTDDLAKVQHEIARLTQFATSVRTAAVAVATSATPDRSAEVKSHRARHSASALDIADEMTQDIVPDLGDLASEQSFDSSMDSLDRDVLAVAAGHDDEQSPFDELDSETTQDIDLGDAEQAYRDGRQAVTNRRRQRRSRRRVDESHGGGHTNPPSRRRREIEDRDTDKNETRTESWGQGPAHSKVVRDDAAPLYSVGETAPGINVNPEASLHALTGEPIDPPDETPSTEHPVAGAVTIVRSDRDVAWKSGGHVSDHLSNLGQRAWQWCQGVWDARGQEWESTNPLRHTEPRAVSNDNAESVSPAEPNATDGRIPETELLQLALTRVAELEELRHAKTRHTQQMARWQERKKQSTAHRHSADISRRRWADLLTSLGLPETLKVREAFTAWRLLVDIVDQRRRVRLADQHLQQTKALWLAFQQRIEELGRRIGDSQLNFQKPLDVLTVWEKRLRDWEAADAQWKLFRQADRGRRARLREMQQQWRQLDTERRALLVQGGATDVETFTSRAQAFADRLHHDETLSQSQETLAQLTAEHADLAIVEDDLLRFDDEANRAAMLVIRQELQDLDHDMGKIKTSLESVERDMTALEDERDETRERFEQAQLESEDDVALADFLGLELATSVLDEMRARFERGGQSAALVEATGYFNRLTQGRFERIWSPLDEQTLRVDDSTGQTYAVHELSTGTREQLFLSLRLALVAGMSRDGVELPIVLDDVLVNFDEPRAAAALALLHDFSRQGHQVLCFTCHRHLQRPCEDLGIQFVELPRRAAV